MTSTTIPTPTAFTALMIDYAQYNLWANQTIVTWLKTKKPQSMEKEIPSSFSSIKKLYYIYGKHRISGNKFFNRKKQI